MYTLFSLKICRGGHVNGNAWQFYLDTALRSLWRWFWRGRWGHCDQSTDTRSILGALCDFSQQVFFILATVSSHFFLNWLVLGPRSFSFFFLPYSTLVSLLTPSEASSVISDVPSRLENVMESFNDRWYVSTKSNNMRKVKSLTFFTFWLYKKRVGCWNTKYVKKEFLMSWRTIIYLSEVTLTATLFLSPYKHRRCNKAQSESYKQRAKCAIFAW